MVTITGFKQCESKEGKLFVAIELQGDLRFVKSESTGNFYLTANKTSLSTSFPIEICKTLIGQKLPGTIKRIACEPYEYLNKETGEMIILSHAYVYSPEEENSLHTQPMLSGFEQQAMNQQFPIIPLETFSLGQGVA